MNNIFTYLVLVLAFQGVLLLSYRLIHLPVKANLNRMILLSTTILSLLLPLLVMQLQWNPLEIAKESSTSINEPKIQLEEIELFMNTEIASLPTKSPVFSWNTSNLSILLYLTGVSFSFFLFIRKLKTVLKIKKQSTQKWIGNQVYFELKNTHDAFNFFNWIFMGNKLTPQEKELIYIHEKEHRNLKHSFDLLLLEILKIIFWFNPLFIWLQRELKAVHEIQADKKIKNQSTQAYALLLLQKTMHCQSITFVNTFNKPLIKTRIMLLKNTQQKRNGFHYLALIPLLLLLISGGSFALNKSTNETENKEEIYLNQLEVWNETGKEEQLTQFAQKVNQFKNHQLSEEEFKMRKAWLKFQSNKSDQFEMNISLNKLKYADYLSFKASNDTISFANVEEVPVFPGCENFSSQDELKACMQQKITEHVRNEFNTKSVKAYSQVGNNRFYVSFIVNTEGKVVDIKARSEKPELTEEGKRVISKLPNMQPAKHKDKAVSISYNLPIVYQIPDKKKKGIEK